MATTAVEAIVVSLPVETMGPGSKYETGRLALKNEYAHIVIEAKGLTVIDSPEALEKANNLGRILQTGTKDVEAFFKPIKQQLDALKSPVLEAENQMKAELDGEKRRLGTLITAWNLEQQRIRQEEERKMREAAEAAAREELLARAVELEVSGDKQAAEEVLNEEVAPVPVVIQQAAAPKMSGQVGKTAYKCEVVNAKELIKAVAEGRAPMQAITVDEGWLNRKAGLDKEGFSVPGCRLVKSTSTHFRS